MFESDKDFVMNILNFVDLNRFVLIIKMFIDIVNQVCWIRFLKVLFEINIIKFCDSQFDILFEMFIERV